MPRWAFHDENDQFFRWDEPATIASCQRAIVLLMTIQSRLQLQIVLYLSTSSPGEFSHCAEIDFPITTGIRHLSMCSIPQAKSINISLSKNSPSCKVALLSKVSTMCSFAAGWSCTRSVSVNQFPWDITFLSLQAMRQASVCTAATRVGERFALFSARWLSGKILHAQVVGKWITDYGEKRMRGKFYDKFFSVPMMNFRRQAAVARVGFVVLLLPMTLSCWPTRIFFFVKSTTKFELFVCSWNFTLQGMSQCPKKSVAFFHWIFNNRHCYRGNNLKSIIYPSFDRIN